MDMVVCPSCGATLPAGERSPACSGCGASLLPAGPELMLVTRAPAGPARRTSKLELPSSFREEYRIEECIGSGGMGMVFRAEQRSTSRPVALKFLMREDDPTSLERFAREAKLLARVSHPGILRVIEFGVVDHHPFLVTELLPGKTLRERIHEAGKLG